MRKIYGIGETVLDIIFKDGEPKTAKAGGSMLNSMISLGRAGLPVLFISEYGLDDVGKLIDDFLAENGVDTSNVYHFNDRNTSLALAFLDDKNDASYTFYKDFPEKRLDIEFPQIENEDIVLCGSFYAIWPEIRDKFKRFISSAKERGALIIYDPNFRKAHLSEVDILKPMIIENMMLATLVRGSSEDFDNIFGVKTPYETWEVVKRYCKCMIYTSNTEGVYVRTTNFSGKFPVEKITPVSTIGAGDNFNAGMITSIYHNKITKEEIEFLGEKQWSQIISTAVSFATDVCLSFENYISMEFANEITAKSTKSR
jgi:fructokinase